MDGELSHCQCPAAERTAAKNQERKWCGCCGAAGSFSAPAAVKGDVLCWAAVHLWPVVLNGSPTSNHSCVD